MRQLCETESCRKSAEPLSVKDSCLAWERFSRWELRVGLLPEPGGGRSLLLEMLYSVGRARMVMEHMECDAPTRLAVICSIRISAVC
jgi:hypothetical protein